MGSNENNTMTNIDVGCPMVAKRQDSSDPSVTDYKGFEQILIERNMSNHKNS
jgi:hypothetical protein